VGSDASGEACQTDGANCGYGTNSGSSWYIGRLQYNKDANSDGVLDTMAYDLSAYSHVFQ
jgi:hypothetical protein